MKTIFATLLLCLSAHSAEYILARGSPSPFPVPRILGISDDKFQADWQRQIEMAIKNRAKAETVNGQPTGRYFYRIIPPHYAGFECIIWNDGTTVYKKLN